MTPRGECPPVQRARRWRIPHSYLRWLALAFVVLVTGVAILFQSRLPDLKAAGYPALFIVSLVGNASVILPLPVILAVCSGGAFLNPLLAGIVGGIGTALGETTGYLAGFSGSALAQRSRVFQRIHPWVRRRGWIVVLAFALFPNPLFDIVGLAAGALRMPLWQFLPATLAGKTIRSIGVAFACSLGYDLFFLPSQ